MKILLLIVWLSVVLISPEQKALDHVTIGYFVGTFLAHAVLAAIITALMAGGFLKRIFLPLAWIAALVMAVAFNIEIHGGPSDGVSILGFSMLGQWLALQIPLGLVRYSFRVRLLKVTSTQTEGGDQRIQFGVRDLLIVMFAAAFVFAGGRVLLPLISWNYREGALFSFLAIVAIIVTIPMTLAVLLLRRQRLAIAFAIGLAVLLTAFEFPLMQQLGQSGPQLHDFIWINITCLTHALLFAGVLRSGGYRLWRIRSSGANSV